MPASMTTSATVWIAAACACLMICTPSDSSGSSPVTTIAPTTFRTSFFIFAARSSPLRPKMSLAGVSLLWRSQ